MAGMPAIEPSTNSNRFFIRSSAIMSGLSAAASSTSRERGPCSARSTRISAPIAGSRRLTISGGPSAFSHGAWRSSRYSPVAAARIHASSFSALAAFTTTRMRS